MTIDRTIFILCLMLTIPDSIFHPLPTSKKSKEWKYHLYEELTHFLKTISIQYPELTHLYTIGTSVLNNNLWVLEITAAREDQIGIPNIKLIGNIHANEQIGKEIILMFAEHILSEYNTNERIQWLVNNTRIHLLPCLNPDTLQNVSVSCDGSPGSRNNIRNVDLNTDFPDMYEKRVQPHQEETKAIMRWLQNIPFILSASLHSSALVVTYPFDSKPQTTWDTAFQILNKSKEEKEMKNVWQQVANVGPSATPDDDTFHYLASLYATTHSTMHTSKPCPRINTNFRNGTINGADWHSQTGTMQDFNYFCHSCMELTLVVSCCRHPPATELANYWDENKEPLLKLVSQVHRGIQGLILNSVTNETVPSTQLQILGRNVKFYSSPRGEYWRILLPGKYHVQADVKGYHTRIAEFEVEESSSDYPQMTWLNIMMIPCTEREHMNINNQTCLFRESHTPNHSCPILTNSLHHSNKKKNFNFYKSSIKIWNDGDMRSKENISPPTDFYIYFLTTLVLNEMIT